MDIILHVGAHRTATTSFQHYLRAHDERLAGQGMGFWGPWRTRTGLFDGLADRPRNPAQARRAAGRVRLNAQMAEKRGTAVLIVTDENMIGTPRGNLKARTLYPDIGARMARIHTAFGHVRRINLQIRSPEAWWASALGYLIPRGISVPTPDTIAALAASRRSWRDVITDLSCACPGTEIRVTCYESFGARPDWLLKRLTGALFVPDVAPDMPRHNKSARLPGLRACLAERGEDPARLPEGPGRWSVFTDAQAAALRESYADDLFWLRAGADGLAILTETPEHAGSGLNLTAALSERGPNDERSARRLAPTGREGAARAQP